MLKQMLKLVGFARKTVQETIDNSTDFIDEAIEQEYIASTIQKAKEMTGDVAEAAGKFYGKTKVELHEALESDTFEPIKNKVEDITSDLKKEGEKLAEKAMSNETVKKVVDEINEVKEKIKSEIVDFTENEEDEL